MRRDSFREISHPLKRIYYIPTRDRSGGGYHARASTRLDSARESDFKTVNLITVVAAENEMGDIFSIDREDQVDRGKRRNRGETEDKRRADDRMQEKERKRHASRSARPPPLQV